MTGTREGARALFFAVVMITLVTTVSVAFAGNATANHGGNVIVVDNSFSDTNETHKTSIQDAVDNASSGDTIEVRSGTYDESVTINVEGLTLKARTLGSMVTAVTVAMKRRLTVKLTSEVLTTLPPSVVKLSSMEWRLLPLTVELLTGLSAWLTEERRWTT